MLVRQLDVLALPPIPALAILACLLPIDDGDVLMVRATQGFNDGWIVGDMVVMIGRGLTLWK